MRVSLEVGTRCGPGGGRHGAGCTWDWEDSLGEVLPCAEAHGLGAAGATGEAPGNRSLPCQKHRTQIFKPPPWKP